MSTNYLKETTITNQSLALKCYSLSTTELSSKAFQSGSIGTVTLGVGLLITDIITAANPMIDTADYQLVNQVTSITTPVDCGVDAKAYVLVNTETATVAAGSATSFTLLNNKIVAGSTLFRLSIQNYGATFGTDGIPLANVGTITDGGVEIVVTNCGVNALAGFMRIFVEIINTRTA